MSNNLTVTPHVADEAINLLQVTNYEPLLMNGTANAELITAMERKLKGLIPFVIETDPEAISYIEKLVLNEVIQCAIIEEENAGNYSHLVADFSKLSGPELIKQLNNNAGRVSVKGRFVAIIPTTNTVAFKAFVKTYDAWTEASLVNDKLSFVCLNKR